MARGHKRDNGNMPTQRVFSAVALGLAMLVSAPAFAYVCDKFAGENWKPSDGQINAATGSPLVPVLLVVGALVVCVLLRRSMPAFICAGIIAFLLILTILGLYEDDPFYQAGVLEGCLTPRSTEKGGLVVLGMLSFAFAALGIFFRIRRVKEA